MLVIAVLVHVHFYRKSTVNDMAPGGAKAQ